MSPKNDEYRLSRSFYIKKNFSWQLLQNCITMVFPLVIRTLFVYMIGDELLGLSSLCTSIVATINVVNFGIDGVFVGRMYRPAELGDTEEVCRQLRLSRTIYRGIGLMVLLGGLIVLPFLENFINGDAPNVNIYLVFAIYLTNTFLSYWLFGHYNVVFKATQQVYYLSRNMAIAFLLQYGLQVFALLMHNYFLYVCFLPISTVFYNVSTYRKVKKEYPEYRCSGETDKEAKMQLARNVVSCAIYKLRDASRNTLDSVIVSAILGLIILSKYQNYIAVLAVPLTLKTVITETITPSLGNYNVTASKKEQYELVKRIWLLELAISGFFSICYFQMVQNFIGIWLGDDHVLQLSVALILSVYVFALGICDFFKMMRQTNSLWEKGKGMACVEMSANLILNIVLAKWLGVFGIVLATVITITLITAPYELRLIVKGFFGEDTRRFLWLLGKISFWIVATNGIVWYIVNTISCNKYILILLQLLFSVGIAGVLFVTFFCMDSEYKSLIEMVIKKRQR